jgi:hypothetical protein
MRSTKALSAEDHKLRSSFEAVRRTLLDEKYADRLEKPLAYWALPDDRRLPLAFLGRTIRDLLGASYEELTSTPGIGQKKISSLVILLHRAAEDETSSTPFGIDGLATDGNEKGAQRLRENGRFNPSVVSEALWAQWRETIRRHNMSHERLGRLAPSLRALPTVIWLTPLNTYLDRTLAEIRQLKTHGEKRVRVVLEVFCVAHEMLHGGGNHDGLAIRLMPTFVPPLEEWLGSVMERDDPPTVEEIRRQLVCPLLGQIRLDAGEAVYELAAGRLGVKSPRRSVRLQSRRMGVTRARVYQLLDECSKVMGVRWPEGRSQLLMLAEKMEGSECEPDALELFTTLRELLFPSTSEQPADSDPR